MLRLYPLDGRMMDSKDALHSHLYMQFSLPAYYGTYGKQVQFTQQLQKQLDEIDTDIKKAETASIPDTASALRSAIASTLETLRSPSATIAQKYESAQRLIEKCCFDKSRMLLTVYYKLTF